MNTQKIRLKFAGGYLILMLILVLIIHPPSSNPPEENNPTNPPLETNPTMIDSKGTTYVFIFCSEEAIESIK